MGQADHGKAASVPTTAGGLLAPAVGMSALGVLCFAYACLAAYSLGATGKARDLSLFIIGIIVLPLAVSSIQTLGVRPDFRAAQASPAETVNNWCATLFLVALGAIPARLWWVAEASAGLWAEQAKVAVLAVLVLQTAALASIPLIRRALPNFFDASAAPWRSRSAQATCFILAFSWAAFALFAIEPRNPYFNPLLGVFAPSRWPDSSTPVIESVALAGFALGLVVLLLVLEEVVGRRRPKALYAMRGGVLGAFIVVTCLFYFDFSLSPEALHYFTNIGPALHVAHGGTPLVDAFSQYGPGPVMVTLFGFQFGPRSFATANIVTQLHNLAFYALWLCCLYRMSRWKFAALWLGFLAIGFVMAAWGYGDGNLNVAPSVVGLRYLPALAMVLAISCLRPPLRHSLFTALSTFTATLWSMEACLAALSIHGSFLVLKGLDDRAFARLAKDTAWAAIPAFLAIGATAAGTLARSGQFPDYLSYLQYLTTYNPLTAFWSWVAASTFLGWIVPLLACFLVLSDACLRVFWGACGILPIGKGILLYRFTPMAILAAEISAYFAGRSVDYTLLIGALPMAALMIPAMLFVLRAAPIVKGTLIVLAALALVASLMVLTLTFRSLLRTRAPYSLALHECRDAGRCSPTSIREVLNQRIFFRPVLEKVGDPWIDIWFDADFIVQDAMSMIQAWTAKDAPVTILLGPLRTYHVASEFALMYTGRWHRWPRSLTFSDQLSPRIVKRIVDAPISLQPGELVIVRRDESLLGVIESELLRRIRARSTLCPLPHPSRHVAAYRVAGAGGCPS